MVAWFQSLHKKIEEIRYVKETDPIALFIPSPKQEIALFTKKRFTFLTGANQIGKSVIVTVIASLFLTNRHPVLKTPKNAVIWISVTDFTKIEQVLMPKFREYLVPGTFDFNVNRNMLSIIRGPGTGNKLFFKSQDAGELSYEGSIVNLLIFDEEHEQKIFNAALMRCVRYRAPVFIAATLTKGMTWMYDVFVKPTLDKRRKDVELIVASQYDNPMLDKKNVDEDLRVSMLSDPNEARIRILGEFINLAGSSVFNPMAINKMMGEAVEPRKMEFVA